ncbi:MAG TPA: TolC family protein [Bryobacteraceae bacterium]|nr:TolC family protein [Bryobacteraceae bacterium]
MRFSRLRSIFALLTAAALLLPGPAAAENAVRIEPAQGPLTRFTRPFRARNVPPVNLVNSPRLESLMRAGNLYLSAQDAVALAVENNLDIEAQRYGPLLALEVLRRARAGGALRSVGVGVAPGPTSVSLQGVTVTSIGAAGTAGEGVSSGGGIVTQLGPPIASFDPTLTVFTNFAHTTSPQSNTILTGTTALIQASETYQAQYLQNWQWGMSAQFTFYNQRVNVNSQLFNLDPYTSGYLDLQITQNLLYGFGSAVNGRNIRVQKNNIKVSNLQFKNQVATTVSAVLNLYWDLVEFWEDQRARQRELAAAEQLLDNNRKQAEAGTLAPIEVTRAEAQVYTSQQDLLVSQTNLLQQETVLKNAISRNGIANTTLADAHIIPLDSITIPAKDDLPAINQLVDQALANRTEVAQSRINIDSNKLNLVGIKNALKPTLQAFAELTNNGLTGALTPYGATVPGMEYLAGGYDNLLAQEFRRNFPNYSVGLALNIPLRNRAAQSDYVTSELELRQNELGLQQNINQVRVDVQNAVIALRQARARYDAAVKARDLQQQTIDADQKRYALGASTAYQIVLDQQTLASAESSEVQALASYSHARIGLDQALGRTLEANHISLGEALAGTVSRPSELPSRLPAAVQP